MATLYRFTCPICAYSAEVAGGEGGSDDRPTRTMVCLDCEELFEADVPLLSWGQVVEIATGPQGTTVGGKPLRCPADEDHEVQAWPNPPGLCPRCATEMTRDVSAAGRSGRGPR